MRKYLCFFRIRFIHTLQYRSAAAAGVVTQFVWGFMELLAFRAFYRADPAAFPMDFSSLASYVWLQQAFLALFMVWLMDNDIFGTIQSGGVAYELARPLDLYTMWFVRGLASRAAKALLRSAPILLVAVLLPAPFRLPAPAGAGAAVMFVLTLALGALCVNAFCMLLYASAFYTINPMGIRIVAVSLVEFLSGAIVPLPFLPERVQRLLALTPFAAMQNLPLRCYSGNLAGKELAAGTLLQLVWFAAMTACGWLWMRKALRRVVVQGG